MFRRVVAIFSAKVITALSKLIGRSGSSIGGKLALRIYPDILEWFGSQVKEKIIFVVGTNGKTSTNNMLYSIIKESGHSCVCNKLGANLETGLISAFIDESTIFGCINADYACMEVDEACLSKVMTRIKPHIILFTNIFRDQLDRYGELDALLNKIKIALEKSQETLLLINADDPSLTDLGETVKNKKYYYGIQTKTEMGSRDLARDGIICKKCGSKLQYEHFFYGQLGHYNCSKCGFKRPDTDFRAIINGDQDNRFTVADKSGRVNFKLNIGTGETYSVYNALAASSCAALIGMTSKEILKGISKYKPQIGRMENFHINKPITLNLAKNPVGFNETIKIVSQDKNLKTVAIGVNNLPQDGRDVSWLWDTNFELFSEIDHTVDFYVMFGMRRYDVALRLKYSGIDTKKIIVADAIKSMVDIISDSESNAGYIISNYSLLFETQKILKGRNQNAGTYRVSSISGTSKSIRR